MIHKKDLLKRIELIEKVSEIIYREDDKSERNVLDKLNAIADFLDAEFKEEKSVISCGKYHILSSVCKPDYIETKIVLKKKELPVEDKV